MPDYLIMTYSFSITTRKGDEYRIKLLDVDISVLAKEVRDVIETNNFDISEIMIDRINGGESTAQEVLHAITGRIADLIAENENLILYYSCDDMNPIPSRNTKGGITRGQSPCEVWCVTFPAQCQSAPGSPVESREVSSRQQGGERRLAGKVKKR